jgi:hypothetical protein
MPRTKECSCDRQIFNSNAIEFVINGSRIELQCHRCDGLVRWWNEDTKKVTPSRRAWSIEECSSMR